MKKVINFPALYLETWKVAARRPVPTSHPTVASAQTLRASFYWLRTCMRKEDHPLLPFAEAVQIGLERHADGTATLTFQPSGASHVEILRKAGVELETPQEPSTPPLTSTRAADALRAALEAED